MYLTKLFIEMKNNFRTLVAGVKLVKQIYIKKVILINKVKFYQQEQ